VEVEASPDTGLAETSYVQCELIRSVNRNRLLRHLGVIESAISIQVTTVVKTLLNH
jgi:mRNA-degrading endonuclease toxin of MazEF toxin-antitoxin module